jgi:hypothetical protein
MHAPNTLAASAWQSKSVGLAPGPALTYMLTSNVRSGAVRVIVSSAFIDKGIKRVGHIQTTTCVPALFPAVPGPATQPMCWNFLDPVGPSGEDSDACGGDSGGPLLVDLGDGPVVAGVTSSGTNATCQPPDHSFDANVYTYRDFILGELGTDATTTCGRLSPVGDAQVDVLGFDGRIGRSGTPTRHHQYSNKRAPCSLAVVAGRLWRPFPTSGA